MKKKIFYAILLVVLAVQILSIFCIIIFQNSLITKQVLTQLTHILRHIDYQKAQQILSHQSVLLDDTQRISIISLDGKVLYDSATNAMDMDNHINRAEIQSALNHHTNNQNEVFIASRISSTLKSQMLYVAKIIYPAPDSNDNVKSPLQDSALNAKRDFNALDSVLALNKPLIIRLSEHKQGFGAIILNLLPYLSLLFVIGIVFSVFLAWFLSRRIISPLGRIKLSSPLKTNPYPELLIFMQKISKQKKKIKKQLSQIREQEEQRETFRRQFSANVTHELKTPLSTILASSEMLKNGLIKPQDEKRFMNKIYEESKRLLTLIDKILRLSFFDENSINLEKTPLDMEAIVRRVGKNLSSLAEEKHIFIDLRIPHLRKELWGVGSLIEDMVYNLVENAIKYSFENTHIEVSLKEKESELVLLVADSGIGIAKEEQKRVFERFYCVDKSRSKKLGGSGLGLSIVRHIADIHNATITLESVLGVGTKMSVIFPYNPKEEATS